MDLSFQRAYGGHLLATRRFVQQRLQSRAQLDAVLVRVLGTVGRQGGDLAMVSTYPDAPSLN